ARRAGRRPRRLLPRAPRALREAGRPGLSRHAQRPRADSGLVRWATTGGSGMHITAGGRAGAGRGLGVRGTAAVCPPQSLSSTSRTGDEMRMRAAPYLRTMAPPLWSPNPRSLLSRAELTARGVHSRRLASEEFVEVIPGFMTPSTAPAELQLIARILQRKAIPGAVISHTTAAELLKVPLPSPLEHAQTEALHCTVPLAHRRRAGARVVVHTRTEPDPIRARGLELSSPIAMLCELSGMLDHDQLVACCDQLVSVATLIRPKPSLRGLRRQAEEARGIHG